MIAGSKAYGTSHSGSDTDEKGVFLLPKESMLAYNKPPIQVDSLKNDITFYSVYRFLELLSTANPNMLDLLFPPEDCILIKTNVYDKILAKRHLFITKQAYFSHAKYSQSQIYKAKGVNKRVNNPFSETPPSHKDFCYWLPLKERNGFETRPIKVDELFLSRHHVSKIECGTHLYRLYDYGDSAQGIFKSEALTPVSIPMEDEKTRFNGILIYNEDAFKKTKTEWKQYWEWKRNRNEERWVSQENGERNWDQKNMAHCIRLLYSAKSIFENGEPIIRLEGEKLQVVRDIRFTNKYDYDYIINLADQLLAECEELKNKSNLPEKMTEEQLEEIIEDIYGELC